jgi:hypothetical protein
MMTRIAFNAVAGAAVLQDLCHKAAMRGAPLLGSLPRFTTLSALAAAGTCLALAGIAAVWGGGTEVMCCGT